MANFKKQLLQPELHLPPMRRTREPTPRAYASCGTPSASPPARLCSPHPPSRPCWLTRPSAFAPSRTFGLRAIEDVRYLSVEDIRHLSAVDVRHLSVEDVRYLPVEDAWHLSVEETLAEGEVGRCKMRHSTANFASRRSRRAPHVSTRAKRRGGPRRRLAALRDGDAP
ncbi:hypothetical protein K523DRAFT_323339 [Schizophyllum commune Tattone D]|nr:hypothetical protein K523DRAFT_323339 [Schizophyllum commune Tattone D]